MDFDEQFVTVHGGSIIITDSTSIGTPRSNRWVGDGRHAGIGDLRPRARSSHA